MVEVAAVIRIKMRAWLLVFFLGSPILVFSQIPDSTFTKKSVSFTTYEYLFSYYEQDGNNSAVTGGTGTEKLQVYINKLNISHALDSFNIILFEAGVDYISSASTDKIDFRVSSASAKDLRFWLAGGYQRMSKNKRDIIGIKPSFGMESDYLSWGLNLWWSGQNKNKDWRYGVTAQLYADDLRWGRLNPDYKRPVTVVYPVELRDSVWFDIYMRYTYNVNFDLQHDINRRMSIGFFPGIIIQDGLLSTPFHRFYFTNESKAVVENFPRQRLKIPLGVQLNTFIGSRVVLQAYYRFYWDDFGINAHTINLETPIKIIPQLTFVPFVRFYTQQGARFFFPYQSASPAESFFTSDYDLSTFTSFKFGGGIRFVSVRDNFFKQLSIRYARYSRSDGLYFNQFTSYINMVGDK